LTRAFILFEKAGWLVSPRNRLRRLLARLWQREHPVIRAGSLAVLLVDAGLAQLLVCRARCLKRDDFLRIVIPLYFIVDA
jgi:hypothetical protein